MSLGQLSAKINARLTYRPDIDGLRAIAILSVVFYHFFPSRVRGGFVGADIFFVISGFLISGIVFKSLRQGDFSFTEFYSRRIKRILPALIIVLASSYAVGWLVLLPHEYKELGKYIASASGFFQNYRPQNVVGYFKADLQPLMHLWSLGIEGQFYLVYPVLILWLWRFGFNLLTISIFLGIFSFNLNIHGVKADVGVSFYSVQTRFWELMVGSMLAYFQFFKQAYFVQWPEWVKRCVFNPLLFSNPPTSQRRDAVMNSVLSIVGLLLILASLSVVHNGKLYPGWWAVPPVIGAAFLMAAGGDAFVNRKILSHCFMVFLGKISFPIYLWHLPILFYLQLLMPSAVSWKFRIMVIAMCFVLAWLTYKFIEKPIQNSKRQVLILNALVILLLLVGLLGYFNFPDKNIALAQFVESENDWNRSGHNLSSDKYSPLSQIRVGNITDLKPAWTYHSGVDGKTYQVETNPVFGEGLLFTTSACCLIGINAKSGGEAWKLELPAPVGRRGLTYYKGILFVPTDKGVYAVTAKDGSIAKTLGNNGVFGSERGLLPPIVVGNHLIFANFLATVEAWNISTGKIAWKTSLEKDGVTPRFWSGISYDAVNGIVFLVTSNSMNFFAKHYGDGYASSLLAIDAENGEVLWNFQEIKREIWDLDMVGAPILIDIHKDGKKIPVAISVSKTGNTILVERKTGKSIFGFEYQNVPPTDIEGEVTSKQQIVISKPEPFSHLHFDLEKDVTNLSGSKRDYVLHKIRNAKSGRYLPVSLNYDVVMYGLNGGAEWPGAAVDPNSNALIVPSNNYPFILRGEYVDKKPEKSKELASRSVTYVSKCAACHGKDLAGAIDWGMGDKYNPSLVGITKRRSKEQLTSIDIFKYGHKYAKKNNSKDAGDLLDTISNADLLELYELFKGIDLNIAERNDFSYRGTYQYLLDTDGQFGSNPPWGYITAINLNNGKIKWRIPYGEVYDKQTGQTYQGDVNVGGVMVTGGGIVFANGTRDAKARAFDVSSGKLLWEAQLPATGSAPPMTYTLDGCQYVVFTASGGYRFGNFSDATVAYRLSSCD